MERLAISSLALLTVTCSTMAASVDIKLTQEIAACRVTMIMTNDSGMKSTTLTTVPDVTCSDLKRRLLTAADQAHAAGDPTPVHVE